MKVLKYKLFHFNDPDTGETRYIGATKHRYVSTIMAQYICASGTCGRPLCEWLSELRKNGKKPEFEVIKEIDSLKERGHYIENFGEKDQLLNVCKKGNDIYINAGKRNADLKRTNSQSKISALIKFYKEMNRFPVSKLGQYRWGDDNDLCDKFCIPHIASYIRVFGSYKEACNIALRQITGDENAVYDNGIRIYKTYFSKEEMALFLLEYKKEHGQFPTVNEKTKRWNNGFGKDTIGLSQQNYYKKFGNLTNARAYAESLDDGT